VTVTVSNDRGRRSRQAHCSATGSDPDLCRSSTIPGAGFVGGSPIPGVSASAPASKCGWQLQSSSTLVRRPNTTVIRAPRRDRKARSARSHTIAGYGPHERFVEHQRRGGLATDRMTRNTLSLPAGDLVGVWSATRSKSKRPQRSAAYLRLERLPVGGDRPANARFQAASANGLSSATDGRRQRVCGRATRRCT